MLKMCAPTCAHCIFLWGEEEADKDPASRVSAGHFLKSPAHIPQSRWGISNLQPTGQKVWSVLHFIHDMLIPCYRLAFRPILLTNSLLAPCCPSVPAHFSGETSLGGKRAAFCTEQGWLKWQQGIGSLQMCLGGKDWPTVRKGCWPPRVESKGILWRSHPLPMLWSSVWELFLSPQIR